MAEAVIAAAAPKRLSLLIIAGTPVLKMLIGGEAISVSMQRVMAESH
jgi:hypothetical protein